MIVIPERDEHETKVKVMKRARVIIATHDVAACPYFKRRRLTRTDAYYFRARFSRFIVVTCRVSSVSIKFFDINITKVFSFARFHANRARTFGERATRCPESKEAYTLTNFDRSLLANLQRPFLTLSVALSMYTSIRFHFEK